jgi:hypothetical protein
MRSSFNRLLLLDSNLPVMTSSVESHGKCDVNILQLQAYNNLLTVCWCTDVDESRDWTVTHGRSIALSVALKDASSRLLSVDNQPRIKKALVAYCSADRVRNSSMLLCSFVPTSASCFFQLSMYIQYALLYALETQKPNREMPWMKVYILIWHPCKPGEIFLPSASDTVGNIVLKTENDAITSHSVPAE